MVAWLKRNWWSVVFFGLCASILFLGGSLLLFLDSELKDRAATACAIAFPTTSPGTRPCHVITRYPPP